MDCFEQAIVSIRAEMDRAGVSFGGQLPPLITIQFATLFDEGRFYDHLRNDMRSSPVFDAARVGSSLRSNTQLAIAGIGIRLTSDSRIDDFVKRHLK